MLRTYFRMATLTLGLAVALTSWCLAGVAVADLAAAPPERLTLDNFNKLMKVEKARAAAPRDANLERAMAMHGDPDTIRRWAAQLDADKASSAAIKSAGMTPQEYTRTLVAVLQAYGVSGLKKQNKSVPDRLMAQVPVENVAFVERHASEIESWGLKAAGKDVKPNTMEDLYVEQDTKAADAPKSDAKDTSATTASKPAASAAAPAKKSKTAKPPTQSP